MINPWRYGMEDGSIWAGVHPEYDPWDVSPLEWILIFYGHSYLCYVMTWLVIWHVGLWQRRHCEGIATRSRWSDTLPPERFQRLVPVSKGPQTLCCHCRWPLLGWVHPWLEPARSWNVANLRPTKWTFDLPLEFNMACCHCLGWPPVHII